MYPSLQPTPIFNYGPIYAPRFKKNCKNQGWKLTIGTSHHLVLSIRLGALLKHLLPHSLG